MIQSPIQRPIQLRFWKGALAVAGLLGSGLALGGCSSSAAAPSANQIQQTQQEQQKTTNTRIQAIQSDPSMSPADKQKAIASLQSRQ